MKHSKKIVLQLLLAKTQAVTYDRYDQHDLTDGNRTDIQGAPWGDQLARGAWDRTFPFATDADAANVTANASNTWNDKCTDTANTKPVQDKITALEGQITALEGKLSNADSTTTANDDLVKNVADATLVLDPLVTSVFTLDGHLRALFIALNGTEVALQTAKENLRVKLNEKQRSLQDAAAATDKAAKYKTNVIDGMCKDEDYTVTADSKCYNNSGKTTFDTYTAVANQLTGGAATASSKCYAASSGTTLSTLVAKAAYVGAETECRDLCLNTAACKGYQYQTGAANAEKCKTVETGTVFARTGTPDSGYNCGIKQANHVNEAFCKSTCTALTLQGCRNYQFKAGATKNATASTPVVEAPAECKYQAATTSALDGGTVYVKAGSDTMDTGYKCGVRKRSLSQKIKMKQLLQVIGALNTYQTGRVGNTNATDFGKLKENAAKAVDGAAAAVAGAANSGLRADGLGTTPWTNTAGDSDVDAASNAATLSIATARAKNIIDLVKSSANGGGSSYDTRLLARDNAYIDFLIEYGEFRRFLQVNGTTPRVGSDWEAATKLGEHTGSGASPSSPDSTSKIKAYNDAVTALTTPTTTDQSSATVPNTLKTKYDAHMVKVKATLVLYYGNAAFAGERALQGNGAANPTTTLIDAVYTLGTNQSKDCESSNTSSTGTAADNGSAIDITEPECKMRCIMKGITGGQATSGLVAANLYSNKYIPPWDLTQAVGSQSNTADNHCTGASWKANDCRIWKKGVVKEKSSGTYKCHIRKASAQGITLKTAVDLSVITGTTGAALTGEITRMYDSGGSNLNLTDTPAGLWPMYYVQKTRYTADLAIRNAIYNHGSSGAGSLKTKINAFAQGASSDGVVTTATVRASATPLTTNPEHLSNTSQAAATAGAWFVWAGHFSGATASTTYASNDSTSTQTAKKSIATMEADKAKFTCEREKKKALYAAALAEFDANTLLKNEIAALKGSLEAERLKVYKRCSRNSTDAGDDFGEATGYAYYWNNNTCDTGRASSTAWGTRWSKCKCDAKVGTADAAADDLQIANPACTSTTAASCTGTIAAGSPQLQQVVFTKGEANAPKLTAITGTASDIALVAAGTSTDQLAVPAFTMAGVGCTGSDAANYYACLTKLQTAAKTKWDLVVTAEGAVKTQRDKIKGVKGGLWKMDTAGTGLTASSGASDANGMLELKKSLAAKELLCKETQLESYFTALAKARTDRIATLKTIIVNEKTEADAVTRCEKPQGPRKQRGDMATFCGEGKCCGAAKGTVNGAVLTVESCQKTDAKDFTYTKPRVPMTTTSAADRAESTKFVFRCIDNAKQLAGPMAALLAAAYLSA